jgi:3-hydroxyacyl-CoA dehydrogenase
LVVLYTMAAVNVVLDILSKMKEVYPDSSFINSLYNQQCNKGGLSKKQLEGLLDKALRTQAITQAQTATLQAIILKKPTRERSKPGISAAAPPKNEKAGKLMEDILIKYPHHKRILFLKSRYDKNENITPQEYAEIERFFKLLIK